MRLRLAFKLHGDEADLARKIAESAGIPVDRIAKLAMQRYMQDVITRAVERMKDGSFPREEIVEGAVVSAPEESSEIQIEG